MSVSTKQISVRALAVIAALLVAGSLLGAGAVAQGPPQVPHRIYGTVEDGNANAVPSAPVEIVYDGNVIAENTTDANGNYDISVTDPDGTTTGETITVRVNSISAEDTVTFGSGKTSEVNFQEGQSTTPEHTFTGTVSNTNGPISGATVDVTYQESTLETTQTAGDGTFSVTIPRQSGLTDGDTVGLNVSATGVQDTNVTSTWQAGGSTDVGTITAPPIPTDTFTGTVTDDDGDQVDGATVEVVEDGTNTVYNSTTTDANGDYTVVVERQAGLTDGTAVDLNVSALSIQDERFDETWDADATTQRDLTVQGLPAATFEGTVTDKTGSGVDAVTVSVDDGSTQLGETTTAADGTYSVEAFQRGGITDDTDVTLSVSAANIADNSTTVTWVAGNTETGVDFSVQRVDPHTVSGNVTDENGDTVDNVDIEATSGGSTVATDTTGNNGDYSVSFSVADGLSNDDTVTIAASGNNLDSGDSQDVTFSPGTTSTVDLSVTVSSGGGGAGGGGGGAGTADDGAADDAPPTVGDVQSTLNLVEASASQTEIADADPDTPGTQVTPEGTESVQSISFAEEDLSGNVDVSEYNNPPQEIRSSVSESVSAAGAVDSGDVSTISVADITPDNDAAADSAATVTFSVPADEVSNPEQLTVIKETYDFEQQEDTWTELDTTLEEEGDEEITVSAEAESFSLFAVAEVEQGGGDGTADDGAEDDGAADDGTADDGATDDGLPGFGAVAALLALIGTMLYARRHA